MRIGDPSPRWWKPQMGDLLIFHREPKPTEEDCYGMTDTYLVMRPPKRLSPGCLVSVTYTHQGWDYVGGPHETKTDIRNVKLKTLKMLLSMDSWDSVDLFRTSGDVPLVEYDDAATR